MSNERGPGPPTFTEDLDRAHAWLSTQGESILREQIELARVPAPPFDEHRRSELIAGKLRQLGFDPELDEIGNVLAWLPGRTQTGGAPPVILAAHMDTIFGPEITIAIRREGSRWVGPGTTDNARGLAVVLALARALVRAEVQSAHPILFAFTVGEEGRGDLRGVKHLFAQHSPLRAARAFIAVDGGGLRRIIHHALGSRRFRISVRGAGGHSWTDWGRCNPAAAIGELIHRLCELPLPERPRTTLTVARLGGGTSINAIPAESWLELDLRSEADEALHVAEASIREAVRNSLAAEQRRAEGPLTADIRIIGERPGGKLAISNPLVQAAVSATRAAGVEPEYAVSSTDANVPMALGIPSIAVGGGGDSGDTHTENEWFQDTDGAAGALRLFSILANATRF
jgi:acetylornithine deacetylase/succinyl-diaminopimelate desuccinylase-like protein